LNQLLRAIVTYVPRHVVLQLLQSPEVARNSGQFLKGTLLFSDISGFTSLSEHLRKKGDAEGAEAIVKVINDYLDVMLAIVFKYNGLLIKFGGDAMLCLFTGEDYGALRAVMAAWEMKQTMLARFSEIQALDEIVELGMKVGGNSGLLLAANVGTAQHMEYILTGGVVEHTAHAESWAVRGDILISRESYALIKDYLEVEKRATGELMAQDSQEIVFFRVVGIRADAKFELPDTWQAVERLLATVKDDPWGIIARLDALAPYLPAGVLNQLVYDPQHGAIEGQHRQVTVMFINFVGMRDIINAYGTDAAEQVTAQLREYFCAMQEEVRYYGGMINKVDLYDQGDKLMVIFGAPVAHEKDAQRAALTALAMQSTLDDLSCSGFLSQRIGINSGYVFAGNVGSSVCRRREYTVMGDDVNVAARLMSAADPGQILISQSVWEQVKGNFVAEDLGSIYVKNKAEPIPIFALQEALRTQDHRPSHTLRSALVGRDRALEALGTCWRALHTRGRKQLAVITGEAGVGKTRLLREWQQQVKAAKGPPAHGGSHAPDDDQPPTSTWVWCRGRAYGQETAGIFVEAVEQLAGFTDDDSPQRRWRKLSALLTAMFRQAEPGWINAFNNKLTFLGRFMGLDFSQRKDGADLARRWEQLEPQARQLEMRLAVCDVLVHAAQAGPLFLILDDLHWADQDSLDMLPLVWDRLPHRTPVLMCLLFRELKTAPVWQTWQEISRTYPPNVRIALKELAGDDHRQLLTNLLHPHKVSDRLCDLILAATDGNPLYVEEVLHTLLEAQTLVLHAGTEWRLAPTVTQIHVPHTLQQIIQSRIDELDFRSLGTRRVLWMAAVIGETFEEDALHHVFTSTRRRESEEDLWRHLETLRRVEMIQDFEDVEHQRWMYRFRHGLVQQVAYENMLIEKRQAYHGVVGQWLETTYRGELSRHYEVLAHHYRHSPMRDKALFYLDKAARKAQQTYANETALRYYTQALALEERWTWRKGQIEVLHILGRREEEREALQALEAMPDAPAFDVAYLWGQYYEAIGEYAQAQAKIEHALELGQAQDNVLEEARSLVQLGLIPLRQGDYDQAKAHYRQMLALFEGRDSLSDEESQILTQSLNGLGSIYRQKGHFDQAQTFYGRALTLSQTRGDRLAEARALNNLGSTDFYRRHFDGALAYYQQALETRRAIGDRAGEGTSLFNLALVASDMGNYDEAQAYFSEALTIQQTIGNRWEQVNIYNSLGIMHQELGDLSTAQTYLRQGLTLAQKIEDAAGQAYILGSLGLVVRDMGKLKVAQKLLTKGLTLAQGQHNKHLMTYFLSYLSDVNLRRGQLEQAITRAQAALALHQEMGMRLFTADDLAILASAHLAAGDITQALNYARQALSLLEECGGEGPEFPQRDYLICYHVLSEAKQSEVARAALQSAYNLVMARAKKIADAALRRSFLEQVPVNREIVREYGNMVEGRQ
jgi:class 3 adenylate cyclase/predicted ATPase